MGLGFDLMTSLFPILFLLIFGVVIFTIIRNISTWNKNNHSPRLTVAATIVAKRGQTYHHNNANGTAAASTSYYVTFEVESGDRMELSVPASEYGYLVEGDRGKLTFQGTRFLSFERGLPC